MLIEKIKIIRRKALRLLELRPIHRVIRQLKQNDYLIMDHVLEVYGYTGEFHTLDYVKYVNQLDIWEIDPTCEIHLKNNLPRANVKITDSYAELRKTDERFDTVVLDNPRGIFGDEKCEHFEIIEDCFRVLTDRSVLIANIIPDILVSKYVTPKETVFMHILKRKSFYRHEDGISISEQHFSTFYTDMACKNGFIVRNIFFVKRNYLFTYIILCLEKN